MAIRTFYIKHFT